jgi:pimeloyl-ACP methyl ester carboxylesterase
MADPPQPNKVEVSRGELELDGDVAGEGPPLMLLHGLTATRRNVVQGSKHLLRAGYQLASYDARGHGSSSPAPAPSAYDYQDLVEDLGAVLDRLGLERPVLVGASMGAGTAAAWALRNPDRVAALVLITPPPFGDPEDGWWDTAADALESDGIDGFLDVVVDDDLPERWRKAARDAARQRLERHLHLEAVADALRVVPRSRPFQHVEELEPLEMPVLVVASRDEADPVHPFADAEAWSEHLSDARLVVEDEEESPLAWRGAHLSRAIEDFLREAGIRPDGD